MFARLVIGALLIVLVGSCAPSPRDERTSLCENLGHLEATVVVFSTPPADATVGQVRGAIEKLDPTISNAEDADVVADADAEALRTEHEAALEALEPYGDDTPLADVPPERLAPASALASRYRATVASLGCADPAATPS